MIQTKSDPLLIDLEQMSAKQLAKKYNISMSTAYRYRRKAGHKRNKMRVNYCPSCGKKTDRRANYCLACYRKRDHATYHCPDCGKEITRTSTRCSKCYGEQRSQKFTGENHPKWKQRETIICPVCNQPFKAPAGEPKRILCSLTCLYKWRAQTQMGKNSHLWKGGISFEPYSPTFNKSLKKSIRERDNHTCQLCQAVENGKAHPVHHIDYDKTNSSPSNLILLCASCHSKTNYNREHWEDYLSGKT